MCWSLAKQENKNRVRKFEKVEQRAAQYFKPLHSRVQVRTHPRTLINIRLIRPIGLIGIVGGANISKIRSASHLSK